MTTTRRISENTQARFRSGVELLPSEIYPAAVGMFESMQDDYQLVGIATNHHDPLAPEYARAYRAINTDLIHILYYPGKDVAKTKTPVTATYITELAEPANKLLGAFLTPMQLHTSVQHFLVAQAGSYGPTEAKHFIYVCQKDNDPIAQDSKNPLIPYNTKINLEEAIPAHHEHPDGFYHLRTEPKVYQHGFQTNGIDKPLCGHYTLQALRRNLANEPIPKLNVFQRNPLLKYFIFGAAIVAGLALIAVGAVATLGALPAVLGIVGFTVGGALLATGVIGGLVSKFKKPKHNYHITPAHQEDHLGYYHRGIASISEPQPAQYFSSEARIRSTLSDGNLERLAPGDTRSRELTEESPLVISEYKEIHSGDDFDINMPDDSVRPRNTFCTIL